MAVCTGVYRHFIVPFYARDFFPPRGKPDTHRYTFSKLLRCNEFERVGFEAGGSQRDYLLIHICRSLDECSEFAKKWHDAGYCHNFNPLNYVELV